MRITLAFILSFVITFIHAQTSKVVLIAYHSVTGNTKLMAEAVASGALNVKGIKVVMKKVSEVSKEDLLNADAIILGSPVHNANPSPEVLKFIETWPFEGSPMKDKLGAVFVTAGGISSGEELVQSSLLHSMMVFGMVVMGGDDWTAPFGASGITDEGPFKGRLDAAFLKKGEGLGRRVADAVMRWKK